MRRLKRLIPALLLFMVLPSLCFTAGGINLKELFHETLPGYRLINTYNQENNTVTADIYLVGGLGNVGQIGLYYDTECLLLAASVNGELVTDYQELLANQKVSIGNFTRASNCFVTTETNNLDKLINEENGEFFFGWSSDYNVRFLDALEEDKKIVSITFKVKDGYTAQELKDSEIGIVSFASDVPSEKDLSGYSSGVYCSNEKNTPIRNSDTGRYSIALYTEYQGIDLEDYTNCEFKDNKLGIRLVTRPDGTKAITGIKKNAQVDILKSMFFLHSGDSLEIYDPDGITPATAVSHGSVAKITGEDTAESIYIAFCDISGDGIADMYDLNLLMRLARGDVNDDTEASIYTVDEDENGEISESEYFEFIDNILKTAQSK